MNYLNKATTKNAAIFAGILIAICGVLSMNAFTSDRTAGTKTKTDVVWQIGNQDGLSIEFASGSRDSLHYVIGKNTPSKDFPGSQSGSLNGEDDKVRKHPYTIVFNKPKASLDRYTLVLNLIYQNSSPVNIEVDINGHRGIFPVSYTDKKDLTDWEANSMLLTKQEIKVPVEASWLKEEDNEITIIPLGLGSMAYDSLLLTKRGSPNNLGEKPYLKPTVFYHKKDGELTEVAELQIPVTQPFAEGKATIQIGGQKILADLEENEYDFGTLTQKVTLPAFDQPQQAEIKVSLDNKTLQASQKFVPAKKWKFYIAARIHNDIGYTDLQPNVNELDTRNTDQVMNILDRYPFYKFNFETTWLVENYLDSRVQSYREKYYKHAAEGRASNNVFYLNLLTGLCSGEELYRATYESHKLHKQHGTNFDWASLTDAPSHSWFLPTLLTDIGVKGFANGSNQTRAPILRFSNLNEESPFYWEGINGEKMMMWYSRSYIQLMGLIHAEGWSGKPNYDILDITMPQFLHRYQRDDYAPDAVMVYGAYVDNAAIPEDAGAPIIKKWNEEHAYPKLIMASDGDYYDYIDGHFKDDLPVYRGGAGAYWEDGAGSSAKATKLNQHTQELLPMAETAAGLSSILMPKYRYKSERFNAAWKNVMFYDEHTWGAYNSISNPDMEFVKRQWEIKESYAKKANLDARTLLTRSLNRLCQLYQIEGNTVFAFNFQPWKRSNPIQLELNNGQYLVDSETDKPVKYDVIYEKEGYRKIRFMAEDVPAMGYKGYGIRSLEGIPEETHTTQKVSGGVAESPSYKLTIDEENGGIKSLIDKNTGNELVDQGADYALNEYLYVSGGKDSKIINHGMSTPPADLTIDQPVSAKILENITTPLGQRIVVETKAKHTPTVRSTYQLYNDIKRIDVYNKVIKDKVRDKEGVYFAYPFKAKKPEFAYQIQNGWLRPNQDQLPGAAREWFTTQNLVRVKDGSFTIALSTPDAPLITLTDINRGKWPTHLDITNGHVFSYVMNNYWFTNYKASQGGTFEFDYSITSGNDLDDEKLAQFDADTRKPILGYPHLSTWSASVQAEDRPLSPVEGSFMQIEDNNLQFVVLKQAEDGKGYIIRLREATGKKGETKITFPLFKVQKAYLANGVEEIKKELTVEGHSISMPYQPNSYTTIRLDLKPGI